MHLDFQSFLYTDRDEFLVKVEDRPKPTPADHGIAAVRFTVLSGYWVGEESHLIRKAFISAVFKTHRNLENFEYSVLGIATISVRVYESYHPVGYHVCMSSHFCVLLTYNWHSM